MRPPGKFDSYRPDIDGLRALAVMAVILFHTFPRYLPGGFVGVDIFFVISGYLITQILLNDLKDGTFSAANFYARRIRRIFPALIVVLVATFALGWNFLLPVELTSLCRNIFASAFFSANLMLLSEVSYFDLDADMKPLLHLWSLGIEEQFYLIWPWILWLLPGRWLVAAIAAMLAGSFALNLALIDHHPSGTFYLPFTRAWELLAGSLLTQLPRQRGRAAEALGLSGLSAITVSLFLFSSHTVFPGWAASLPVIGAMLVLMSEGSFISRLVFTHRTAVNVGLISYPLYLWHWPLLVFARIHKFSPLTDPERGLIIAATFILAWLTYRLLERPIRSAFQNDFAKPLIVSMAAVAIVTQAPSLGFGPKLPDAIAHLISVRPNGEGWRVNECLMADTTTNGFFPDCADQKRPLLAIWGDSTAGALIPGFRNLQKTHDFGLAQYTVSSCPPTLLPSSVEKFCLQRNREIVALIGVSAPEIVLLHALWSNNTIDELRPTIEAIRAQHVSRIIILGPVPVWPGGLPNAVAAYFWRTRTVMPERSRFYFDPSSSDDTMRKIAADLGVEYISAREVFCDKDTCLTRVGDSLVASDWLHLTRTGSEFLADAIAGQLRINAKE
jgi:peptidoglycan/LPS O-acetylase OafA/YrhL